MSGMSELFKQIDNLEAKKITIGEFKVAQTTYMKNEAIEHPQFKQPIITSNLTKRGKNKLYIAIGAILLITIYIVKKYV